MFGNILNTFKDLKLINDILILSDNIAMKVLTIFKLNCFII